MGALDEEVAALARGSNVASLTTLLPDGSPVSSLMWIDADDDHLLINTERHRLKYRNVCADPRVQVLIIDQDDSGHYAAVRGVVSEQVGGQAARRPGTISTGSRRSTWASPSTPNGSFPSGSSSRSARSGSACGTAASWSSDLSTA